MKEFRVDVMKVTVEYFSVDVKAPNQDAADKEGRYQIMRDPARHQEAEQNIVWGTIRASEI